MECFNICSIQWNGINFDFFKIIRSFLRSLLPSILYSDKQARWIQFFIFRHAVQKAHIKSFTGHVILVRVCSKDGKLFKKAKLVEQCYSKSIDVCVWGGGVFVLAELMHYTAMIIGSYRTIIEKFQPFLLHYIYPHHDNVFANFVSL